MQHTPVQILVLYGLTDQVETCDRFGDGHINDTFRVTVSGGMQYILQRLSPVAFHDPERLMENIAGVTAFLKESIQRRGGDPARETLTIVPTADGRRCIITDEGCWRMYLSITNSVSFSSAADEEVFRQSGRGFGSFMRDLCGYPAATLHETIPHFHDTPQRVEALREAIRTNAAGRADSVAEDIGFVLSRAQRAGSLLDKLARGELPLRVTHNDTKLNNVLMDASTHAALCVIDLDTVMPGLCAYDFGDAIRFGANTAAEDERDLTKVHFSMPMFRAYCEGYLGEAGSVLTPDEISSLPEGAWMMTYECGVRFLTDYLSGDVYFHTAYPEHNLVRARNQFALLHDMEKQEAAMTACVRNWIKE